MPEAKNGASITTRKGASRAKRLVALCGEIFLGSVTVASAAIVLLIFFTIVREAVPFFSLPAAADTGQESFIGDIPEAGTGSTEESEPELEPIDHVAPARQFFTSSKYYPAQEPPIFGGLALFYGSAVVTLGALLVALPLGVAAAVCMSDILPFRLRQKAKPVIEVLAAIPSVAYGFFALVLFAPMLQDHGGRFLAGGLLVVGLPILGIIAFALGDVLAGWAAAERRDRLYSVASWLMVVQALLLVTIAMSRGLAARGALGAIGVAVLLGGGFATVHLVKDADRRRMILRRVAQSALGIAACFLVVSGARALLDVTISTGTNVLNVSIILGVMALPTVVSVSEDALFAAGRELREASYGLGATRAETLLKVIVPAARSGILAAAILGTMRAVGETMVVLMASGNAAQIPDIEKWQDVPAAALMSARTLTATIAQEMNEIEHTHGAARFSCLFTMSLCLLTFSFVANLVSEWAVSRSVKRLKSR